MFGNLKIRIDFSFLKTVELKKRRALKIFADSVMRGKGKKKEGAIRIVFCSDEELLAINREFLKHDYYTDIITFQYTEEMDSLIEGELYISVDRVRDNARSEECSVERELHRVIFHGLLHLCGFGDKTTAEKLAMRAQEEELLDEYFPV